MTDEELQLYFERVGSYGGAQDTPRRMCPEHNLYISTSARFKTTDPATRECEIDGDLIAWCQDALDRYLETIRTDRGPALPSSKERRLFGESQVGERRGLWNSPGGPSYGSVP